MDKLLAIQCGNTSRLSHVPPISKLQSLLSFTDASYQPRHANKQWSNLEELYPRNFKTLWLDALENYQSHGLT